MLGLSLAGWPQGFVGESQGGYWSLRGADQSSLARYTTEGDYVEFTPGEKVTVEGVIDGMEYYGPLEALPLPLLGPEPQSSEGEALRNGTSDVLFPPLQQIFAQGAAANYSNSWRLMASCSMMWYSARWCSRTLPSAAAFSSTAASSRLRSTMLRW